MGETRRAATGVVGGVDGCPGGWICVLLDRESRALSPLLCRSSGDLMAIDPEPIVLAIDIPIGLTDASARECDLLARKRLGPRRSSVFPAPIRPALAAVTQRGADAITREVAGRGINGRAWGLYRRVLSIDLLIGPEQQLRCVEVHPELSFLALNGEVPLAYSKRDPAGVAERRALIEASFGPGCFARLREAIPTGEAADDDLLDAMAACWTSDRIAEGTARRIPDHPLTDSRGLRMEMWY